MCQLYHGVQTDVTTLSHERCEDGADIIDIACMPLRRSHEMATKSQFVIPSISMSGNQIVRMCSYNHSLSRSSFCWTRLSNLSLGVYNYTNLGSTRTMDINDQAGLAFFQPPGVFCRPNPARFQKTPKTDGHRSLIDHFQITWEVFLQPQLPLNSIFGILIS